MFCVIRTRRPAALERCKLLWVGDLMCGCAGGGVSMGVGVGAVLGEGESRI